MAITMFDCGFGDSFLIEECVDRPLLVDFGVYFRPKVLKYENVINQIGGIEDKDFLLTHFHKDHFSGMLYWKNNLRKFPVANRMFKKVYIPAINHVSVIKVLLLGNLGKSNPLLDFLTVFCKFGWRGLECVGTGDKIGGLTVLCPDTDLVYRGSIVDYANRLLEQIDQNEIFVEEIEGNRIYLNQYGHVCNIVFHNTEANSNNQRNILFTGDIERCHMKKIVSRHIPHVKLHEKYNVIKIPHHGTEHHYFDFSNFCISAEETIFLISNGKVPKRNAKWRTDNKYNISNTYVCTNELNGVVQAWKRARDIYVPRNGSQRI